MENRFLLTYSYENMEGIIQSTYYLFNTENEMRNHVNYMKEQNVIKWEIKEMVELISIREIL